LQLLKLNRDLGAVKAWLSSDASTSLTDNMWEHLHLAAWTGDLESIKLRVRSGADLSLPDQYHWTALHLAVWNMHSEMVLFLLDAIDEKTSISLQNLDGVSALHLAALNNDIEMIETLIKAGANTSVFDKAGLTPLLCAAKAENIEALIALKKLGADTSVPNKSEWTPLHWAAANGDLNTIKALK
jgi:uncharacterized protein